MRDGLGDKALRRPRRRLSLIWLVPLLAVLVGLWLLLDTLAGRGPQVTLIMTDAEGIEAGTPIKARNVDIGRVERLDLTENLSHVVATARMNPGLDRLLVEDTRFWVVKPRISREGISGLGTVLSGPFIQVQPGDSEQAAEQFEVLAQPPVSQPGVGGLRVRLESDVAHARQVGDPVSFQGYPVGQVEEVRFDPVSNLMIHRLFIESPYQDLVTDNVRFWSASGVELRVDAEGLRVRVDSLEALLAGGITFGHLPGLPPGAAVEQESSFKLFPDRESALQDGFDLQLEYVMMVEGSVRGLHAGAPVEFRGVRVGTVAAVPWNFRVPGEEERPRFAIPVLLRIQPQRLADQGASDPELSAWANALDRLFDEGLRASLRTANLLTGALYVDLDFHPSADEANPGVFANLPIFPSTSGGFAQMEGQIAELLDKLIELDLAAVLEGLETNLSAAESMLRRMDSLAASLQTLLAQPETRALPTQLNQTLEDLSTTLEGLSPESEAYGDLSQSLRSLERLLRDLQPFARTLREQPSALIFDRGRGEDPEPRAAP